MEKPLILALGIQAVLLWSYTQIVAHRQVVLVPLNALAFPLASLELNLQLFIVKSPKSRSLASRCGSMIIVRTTFRAKSG